MEWDPAVVAAHDEWQEAQLTQAKGEVALRPQGSVSLRPVQFSGEIAGDRGVGVWSGSNPCREAGSRSMGSLCRRLPEILSRQKDS